MTSQQPVLDSSQRKKRRLPERYVAVAKNVRTMDKKVRFVMYLFSEGPREYDFLLKILSLGSDQYWRKTILSSTRLVKGDRVLDIACGTGLVSFEFAASGAQVVGIDVTREMLVRANELKKRLGRNLLDPDVEFIHARAENLPLRQDVFSAATISLAMRNVSDIRDTIQEMRRCVRQGGEVMSMDFTMPNGRIFRHFYNFYIFELLPTLGLIISRHWNGIFSYLANSIKRSKSPEQISEIMRSTGLVDVRFRRMTRGVTALTIGKK